MVLLASDVSSPHVLMGTSMLPLTSRDTIASKIYRCLLMNIACLICNVVNRIQLVLMLHLHDGSLLIVLHEVLAFVEVVLGPHASLSLRSSVGDSNGPASFHVAASCRPPSVRRSI